MDRLTIINRALQLTANRTVNLDDGTDEWIAAETALETAIADLQSRHKWPFATKEEVISQVPAANNPSQSHQFAYALPGEILHLRVVLRQATTTNLPSTYPLTDYELMSGHVCTNVNETLIARFVYAPPDAAWHPQAETVLRLMTEAGILRALNEDFDEAKDGDAMAEARLAEARPYTGQENPGRNRFSSAIGAARRRRRG